MKTLLLVLVVAYVALTMAKHHKEKVELPSPTLPPRERAQILLNQMTFNEKLAMVHGYGGPYVGNVAAIPRLNIPILTLEDGPQGVGDGTRQVTCWPSALTVVSSFDPELMRQFGQGMGLEQRGKGTNIMLGPMVNLLRVPEDGRSFESMGEDPYLAGVMAAAEVKGIQGNGVVATVKHLVDNNQEYNRTTTSANIDERTQYELYLRPFKAAIDAGVGSIMCSYNRVNNVYACENNDTLNTAVKEKFGFQGFVMSDWGATHSTVNSANNGLDMQMPDASFFGTALQQAILKGQVSHARLDDMNLRILTALFMVGVMDAPQTGNLSINVQSDAHTRLARTLGEAGTTLLKNTGNLLPLSKTIGNIAISGDDGSLNPTAVGDGSGYVVPPYIVTPLAGIQNVVSGVTKVTYAGTNNVTDAVNNAKSADVAIVFVAVDSSEGTDRTTLSLGEAQDNLVAAVAAVQPKTIVVVHAPGPVLMPWINSVQGVVYGMLPGQEDGNVIARILFGDALPGGRLPFSIPKKASDSPVNTITQYPGINNEAKYSEGLFIGYRWFDQNKVAPLFEFGFGLTYTSFSYSNLQVTGSVSSNNAMVSFTVTNSGSQAGVEVSQLYLGFPSSAMTPPKQLRGFSKFYLTPGQSRNVMLPITSDDVNIWDVTVHDWKIVSGQFGLFVGSSSRNILLTGTLTV